MNSIEDIVMLGGKYITQIEIESTDYEMVEGAVSDIASLTLIIPIGMINEYNELKGEKERFPNGLKFWMETSLHKLLREFHQHRDLHLQDILDYLEGKVECEFEELKSHKKVRLYVSEIPQMHPEFYKR